jgi:hypothetical protein
MALYYELETLELFITEQLHPSKLLRDNNLSEKEFTRFNELLTHEKESVKRRLKKVTYSYPKETHRKLYIQQHQFAVTHLKNLLLNFLLPKNAIDLVEMPHDSLEVKIYKRSLASMKDLFSFIKEEFPQYFNYDEKVPAAMALQLQESVRLQINKTRKQLSKASHDTRLIEIIFQTVQEYYKSERGKKLTYKRLSYLKILMKELEGIDNGETGNSHYPKLAVFLVYMNFNTPDFKNYFVRLIHEEINRSASLAEKIEVISFHHKEVSQLQVKPCCSLVPESPSVQLDIVTWLFNEMSHLEKKQTLGLVAPVEFKEPGDPDTERGIYSVLTVEELGLLLKIQKETNMLKNKNMKQVARNIAENWHTKQKENISWQYLYNSMSTVEMGTIRSLEDKLVGLVNWLRKMKGRM